MFPGAAFFVIMAEHKLTPKQRRFIEAYLQTWNASEAARQAGYRGAVDRTGSRLLGLIEIQAAVKARMVETTMQSDEVLKRLADQATLNASRFFVFEEVDGELVMAGINWRVFRDHGYLVKKLSYDRKGRPVIEFHDAQRALELIGKAYGMFVDKIDQTQHSENVNVNIYIPDNGRGDGNPTPA